MNQEINKILDKNRKWMPLILLCFSLLFYLRNSFVSSQTQPTWKGCMASYHIIDLYYKWYHSNINFFKIEKNQKMLKKQWIIYNIFIIFKEILGSFEIYKLSKISRKFREKFRKFWNYGFVGIRAAESPTLANILKINQNSMETCIILKFFMNF